MDDLPQRLVVRDRPDRRSGGASPGPPEWGLVEIYALAFVAQVAVDFAWSLIRNLTWTGFR